MKRCVFIQGGLGNQMFGYAFFLLLKRVYPQTEVSTYFSATTTTITDWNCPVSFQYSLPNIEEQEHVCIGNYTTQAYAPHSSDEAVN